MCIRDRAKRRETFKNDSSVSEWLRFVTKNENSSFSDEEVVVSTNLLALDPDFFQNATISGLLFHSRGSWKREKIRPTRDGVYGSGQLIFKGSKYSDLRQNFRDKADYSSWCIFKHPNHAKHYAQINAFFQIQVGDNALDGLIVASVTSRNYQQNTKYNLVKIESQRSLNSNILFVSIKDTPGSVSKGNTLNFKGMVPLGATLVDSTKIRVPFLRVGTLKTKGTHPYWPRVWYP